MGACDLWGVFPWQVRVPFEDVGAQFVIADTTWFEDEQTLFVFYQVDSVQGLSDASQIEITYRTDDVFQPYTPLHAIAPVHHHYPADCGVQSMCGSFSIAIERIPRDVDLRLRYHRDGELFLETLVDAHVVATGAPHNSRSAIVYGVFDRLNTHVQWRLRHQFPAIRNEHAQALGLRRELTVDAVTYGTLDSVQERFVENPYGYGHLNACPPEFEPHANEVLHTITRAVFDTVEMPIASSDAPHVCGEATVTDARGTFTTAAFAQKNPETRQAFPELATPIDVNRRVPFYFQVCNDPTSDLHQAMQMQRLFLVDGDRVCIDDYDTIDFPSRLATLMTAKIDAERQNGKDMVLVIGLNRPNVPLVAQRVEEALGLIIPLENAASTPRVSGVFVYDTRAYQAVNAEVARLTLWCPSSFNANDLDAIPDTSARSCAVQPVQPLALGDLELSTLPILPTETQFENFIEKYGPGQTGNMTGMSFRAPIRTPTSVNVPLGDFGVATFFNNEAITPEPGHAFSYCAEEDSGFVVVRIEGFPDVFPISFLGELHSFLGFTRYELGLFWDFPFLMQIKYNSTLATTVELPEEVPFIVALGLQTPSEQFLGTAQWEQESFELGQALLQCLRFCDHPTFDSSAVYNADDFFRETYAARCYRPSYPAVGDDGFPPDP